VGGGGVPFGSGGQTSPPQPELPDLDGEPSEEEFDITDNDRLFGCGIASGEELLGTLGDPDDPYSL
jgi:hypothetical protein